MSTSSGSHDYGRFDVLAREFAERSRHGENPVLQEYVDRLPEMADEIREIFPALLDAKPGEGDDHFHQEGTSSPVVTRLHQIGDYRILREIGRGGMGVVYEAEQISLGRRVAVKVLPGRFANDPNAMERFRREAKAMARLHHTNIVPVFEIGHEAEFSFYAMQLIEGQGLDQVISELRKLRNADSKSSGSCFVAPDRPTALVSDFKTSGDTPTNCKDSKLVRVMGMLLTGQLVTEPMEHVQTQASKEVFLSTNELFSPNSPSDKATGSTQTQYVVTDSVGAYSAVIPGGDHLSEVKSNGSPVEFFRSVAQIGRQAAQGLAHAHSRGIMHRDIKPSNLLLDTDGVVWIADFGLAKSKEDNLTATGDVMGTLRYMAPCRFRGVCDNRADIYSLGMTLFELMTLRPAFDTSDRLKLMEEIKSAEPPRPRSIDRRIPRDLETIVLKAIEKERDRRYQTAEAMAEDLRRFLADEPILARRASAPERYARWARHHPDIAILGAVLTGVLVLVTIASMIAATQFRELWHLAEIKTREVYVNNQRLERQLYINRVNLAQREALTNIARAEVLLDQCPTSLRGWEWNYVKRYCHDEIRTLSDHTRAVNTVAFSPDGRLLISGAGERFYGAEETHDAELTLWETGTGRKLRSFAGLKGGVNSAAFSPDGKFVAVGSGYFRRGKSNGLDVTEGHLTVWDVESGKLQFERIETGSNLLSVAFSPDGKSIAAGYGVYSSDKAGIFKIWDARKGTVIRTIASPPGGVNCVAFSPDGTKIALACSGVVDLWQVEPFEKLGELRGHFNWIYSVVFSPDGKRLATGSWDKTIKIWDAASGSLILNCEGQKSLVNSVAFSPDSKILVSSSDESIMRGWEVATGREIFNLRGHLSAVTSVTFSPDGTKIASGGADKTVKLWDSTADSEIILRDHKGWVTGVAFRHDGQRIVTASGDRTFMIWDPESGRRLETSELHRNWIEFATYSPDGRYIAATADNSEVRLWDAATLRKVMTSSLDRFDPRSLAFSPDGRRLAVGYKPQANSTELSGIVQILEIPSGRLLLTYRGHTSGVEQIAFSPDGSAIASVGGDPRRHFGEVRLWDSFNGKELGSFKGHKGCVQDVAFSPDGKRLATASHDTTVKLWDLGSGQLIHTMNGHTDEVHALAFSHDGARLATGGIDMTIKLWNVETGDEVLTLRGHTAGVVSLAFSPDDRLLISGSIDWTARVWDASPAEKSD